LTSPANWIAPPNCSNSLVNVILPVSRCEAFANDRPAQNLVCLGTHQSASANAGSSPH
jgi:hypothetical protein